MFNKNYIIEDEYLVKYKDLDINNFFKKINSKLYNYKIDNILISDIITKLCKDLSFDPRIILTKLQVEQSLLFSEITQNKLDWAMGFGVPDSGFKNDKYKGFYNQIKGAIQGFKNYINQDHIYNIGNKVNKRWIVSDGEIVCKNVGTATLYKYTPWIGYRDYKNKKSPFGNFLFYKIWNQFFGDEEEMNTWKIICPPDNYDHLLEGSFVVTEDLKEISSRLGLAFTRNNEKVYIGIKGKITDNLKNKPVIINKEKDWKIICDPDNWKNPILTGGETVNMVGKVADRLQLSFTKNKENKKVYLGYKKEKSFKFPLDHFTDKAYDSDSGVDFACPVGTEVYSPCDGYIIYSEWGHTPWGTINYPGLDTPYSILIEMKDPIIFEGKEYYYVWMTHMSKLVYNVPDGGYKEIKQGEYLGKTGLGNRNSHLHMGILIDRAQKDGDFMPPITMERFMGLTRGKSY